MARVGVVLADGRSRIAVWCQRVVNAWWVRIQLASYPRVARVANFCDQHAVFQLARRWRSPTSSHSKGDYHAV